MLLLRGASRALSTTARLQAAASTKTKLAKLRKLTGYSFVHCKRALQEHDYDVERAEQWLRARAQAEGWARASQLGARATPQGLVCLATRGRSAAMVEINCETDFVARNAVFEQLVRETAAGCLALADAAADDSIAEVPLSQVAGLADRVALAIGRLGENVTPGRATVARAGATTHLASYVHPGAPTDRAGTHVGRYAAVVLFEMFDSGRSVLSPHKFGRNLCQHVVGMAPRSLGDPRPPDAAPTGGNTLAPAGGTTGALEDGTTEAPADGTAKAPADGAAAAEGGDGEDAAVGSQEAPVETLLDQEYLVEPELTVREVLAENNARIIDFVRMECGETAASED